MSLRDTPQHGNGTSDNVGPLLITNDLVLFSEQDDEKHAEMSC